MIFVGLVIGIVLLAIAFAHFDKLLRFQYQFHKPKWEDSGKAGGFFWSPPESPFFSGSVQRTVRFLAWTFGSEEWMQSDNSLVRSLRVMRFCVLMFSIVWIVLVFTSTGA